MPPSPRLGIPVPTEADPPDGPVQMDAIVDVLDEAAIDGQGLLAARPAANTVPRGFYWWSTDSRQLSRSDGAAWHDLGQAGLVIGDYKFSAQAADHTGWILCNGRNNIPRADHPADFVALMLALGYVGVDGTTFGVPDFRGRMPVGVGTHGDVDQLGEVEPGGLAVGARRPRHRHTVDDPGHEHGSDSYPFALRKAGDSINWPGAGAQPFAQYESATTGNAVTGITVGPPGAPL